TVLALGQCMVAEARNLRTLPPAEIVPLAHAACADAPVEPQHGVLACKKILNTYGVKPRAWRAGLPVLLDRYFRQGANRGLPGNLQAWLQPGRWRWADARWAGWRRPWPGYTLPHTPVRAVFGGPGLWGQLYAGRRSWVSALGRLEQSCPTPRSASVASNENAPRCGAFLDG